MKPSQEALAWRRYPEPDGTHYTAEQLKNDEQVERLFDYCQILEAAIFASGWRLLFKTHGLAGLLGINRRSGWFDQEDDREAEEMFMYFARLAGYDPEQDVFGTYNEETGVFTAAEET